MNATGTGRALTPSPCPRSASAQKWRIAAILEPMHHSKSPIDMLLIAADSALRALSGTGGSGSKYPASNTPSPELSDADRRLSGALMRVNHVGEICAQALYTAQAMTARDPALRRQFEKAAREETDHLAWTRQRLRELNARASFLNPLWYAGSFGIGLIAGRADDSASLGFVVETERQVERHLEHHLERLPLADTASRAVVTQMKEDEARHAAGARAAGAVPLAWPVRWTMRLTARVMTSAAYYL